MPLDTLTIVANSSSGKIGQQATTEDCVWPAPGPCGVSRHRQLAIALSTAFISEEVSCIDAVAARSLSAQRCASAAPRCYQGRRVGRLSLHHSSGAFRGASRSGGCPLNWHVYPKGATGRVGRESRVRRRAVISKAKSAQAGEPAPRKRKGAKAQYVRARFVASDCVGSGSGDSCSVATQGVASG